MRYALRITTRRRVVGTFRTGTSCEKLVIFPLWWKHTVDKCFTKLLSRVREMPRAPVPLSMLPVHDHVSWPLTRMQEMPRSPVSFSLLPSARNSACSCLSLSVTCIGPCVLTRMQEMPCSPVSLFCYLYMTMCPDQSARNAACSWISLSVTCIWPCLLTRVQEMPRAPVSLSLLPVYDHVS